MGKKKKKERARSSDREDVSRSIDSKKSAPSVKKFSLKRKRAIFADKEEKTQIKRRKVTIIDDSREKKETKKEKKKDSKIKKREWDKDKEQRHRSPDRRSRRDRRDVSYKKKRPIRTRDRRSRERDRRSR